MGVEEDREDKLGSGTDAVGLDSPTAPAYTPADMPLLPPSPPPSPLGVAMPVADEVDADAAGLLFLPDLPVGLLNQRDSHPNPPPLAGLLASACLPAWAAGGIAGRGTPAAATTAVVPGKGAGAMKPLPLISLAGTGGGFAAPGPCMPAKEGLPNGNAARRVAGEGRVEGDRVPAVGAVQGVGEDKGLLMPSITGRWVDIPGRTAIDSLYACAAPSSVILVGRWA